MRNFLLGLGLVGAALGATLPLHAQSTEVRGVVRDAETGEILRGVEVRIVDSEYRTRTDARGAFRLPVASAGSYLLEASAPGYTAERSSAEVPQSGVGQVGITLGVARVQVPQIEVIGRSGHALRRVPGSVSVIAQEELQASLPFSGNEAFRKVTGVHVQEEEGAGLRANIGIRGLDPDRSRTVLMLEDGIPVALNPYGEPEMYYTPPIDRMERVEIVKGSGSILFGPQTVGGVINYVTAAPPTTPGGSISLQSGTGGFLRALGTYGGTWDNVGTSVSVLRKQADDLRGLFFGVTDVTGKVGFAVGERSRFGFKASVYDEESNSTYVGLTEQMFRTDPNQHPAVDDRLRMRRYAASGTHDLVLGAGARLRTTAYGYTTTRDWQRQDFGYSADGTALVFRPSTGNRNRSFEVLGVEPRLEVNHALFGVPSELDAGFRALWERAYDAHINGTTATARTGELRDYEIRTGNALAAYVQNRFLIGESFRLSPGVRVESYRYDRNILRTRVRRQDPVTGATTRRPEDVDIRSGDDLVELIPGIGASWLPSERVTLFAGAHRGFAPPRVKDALIYDDQTLTPGQAVGDPVSLRLDAERSWNLEAGVRTAPFVGATAEATVFLLDFSNQIIPPSLSSGSVAQGQLANQGETRHVGVESAFGVDFGTLAGLPFGLTAELRYTRVRAEFSADRFMRNAAGDTVNVRGNRLPYAPENLWVLGFGVDHPAGITFRLDGTRVGAQFTDNFQTVQAIPNGRNGQIPGYSVWDAAATYRLPWAGGITAFGAVKNLFDETYIASRRPEGIKPGLPRLLNVGVRVGI